MNIKSLLTVMPILLTETDYITSSWQQWQKLGGRTKRSQPRDRTHKTQTNDTQKVALINSTKEHTHTKPMLRETEPGLVALYDI